MKCRNGYWGRSLNSRRGSDVIRDGSFPFYGKIFGMVKQDRK